MAKVIGSRCVVLVESGSGAPREKSFVVGTEVAPFSVGSAGMWRVSGDGIADVHGFLYFDGESLFVQSAGTRFVVTVDGQAVGTEWSPIRPPCRIQMGTVILSYHDAVEDEGETIASANPPVLRSASNKPSAIAPSARPFRPGEFASVADDGATRVQDISTGSRSVSRQPVATSRSGGPPQHQLPTPLDQPPTHVQPSQVPLMHVQLSAPQPLQPAATSAPNSLSDSLARARAAFNAMSMPMKLSAALVPVALMLLFMIPPEAPRPKRAGADAGAPLTRDGGIAAQDSGTSHSQTAAQGAAASDVLPEGGAIIEFNADVDAGVVHLAPGKKTDERQAIDKAAAGKYLEAAALYDQLARENPTKPAYIEAAKIMRARAGKPR